MKNLGLDFLFVIGSIALTAICWGAYGPVLHRGQTAMEGSRLRPLLCVGIAYFVIAVVVPLVWLYTRGEKGDWTFAGAVECRGRRGRCPGCAGHHPGVQLWRQAELRDAARLWLRAVVNAFLTIYWAGSWKEVSPMFLAGLILVAVGAFTVLFFAPKGHAPSPSGSGHSPAAVEPAAEHGTP